MLINGQCTSCPTEGPPSGGAPRARDEVLPPSCRDRVAVEAGVSGRGLPLPPRALPILGSPFSDLAGRRVHPPLFDAPPSLSAREARGPIPGGGTSGWTAPWSASTASASAPRAPRVCPPPLPPHGADWRQKCPAGGGGSTGQRAGKMTPLSHDKICQASARSMCPSAPRPSLGHECE